MAQEWYVPGRPSRVLVGWTLSSIDCFIDWCWVSTCYLYFLVFRCLNYGVLSHKKAEKLFAIYAERKKKLGGVGGATSPPPKKKKPKIVKEEAIDPGMQDSGPQFVGSGVI